MRISDDFFDIGFILQIWVIQCKDFEAVFPLYFSQPFCYRFIFMRTVTPGYTLLKINCRKNGLRNHGIYAAGNLI